MDSDEGEVEGELVSSVVSQASVLFKEHDNISRVIKYLELPTEKFEDRYGVKADNKDTKPFEAMIRLALYRETKGLSQLQTTKRVRNLTYLQQRFGLDGPITQPTISNTHRHRFPLRLRVFIQKVAKGIRDEADAQGIRISQRVEEDSPELDEIAAMDQPLYQYVDKNAPEVIERMLDDIAPEFSTGRASNAKYPDKKLWEQQILMSLTDRSGTPSAYRTFNKFHAERPHHDTHVRAVKKLGTPEAYQFTFDEFADNDWKNRPIPDWRRIADTIQDQYSDAVSKMIDTVSGSEVFTLPAVAAIDITSVPVHVTPWKGEADVEPDDTPITVDKKTGRTRVPKDDYPEMINGGQDDGEYEYQYATLTIVGANMPIIIAAEPVRHHSNWEGGEGQSVTYAEIVDRLMEQATDIVDIHLVMADRAFATQETMHVLDNRYDVTYLMPLAKRSNRLQTSMAEVQEDPAVDARIEKGAKLHLRDEASYIDVDTDPDVGKDNFSHEADLMYVPADRDDWIVQHMNGTGYALFVTNRDVESPMDAEGLVNRYSDRWDIENEYRMVKPMYPSIASKDYRMRFFAFVFSTLLYNTWRLVDHTLKAMASEEYDDYGRGPHEDRLDPVLTLADFLASSLVVMMLDGLDPPGKRT